MEMILHAGDALSLPHAPGFAPERSSILVLDPDWDCREILCALLDAHGYRAVPADSAETAAALANQYAFALIVSESRDWSGRHDVLPAIRETPEFAVVPLIVHTAWLFPADLETAAEHGALAFIPKPSDHHVLLSHVARCVGRAGSAGPAAQPASIPHA